MITVLDGSIGRIWVPIKPSATIYMGSIVCVDMSALDEGVVVREQADGASNTTNTDIPWGVAIGHNLINPVFDSTYLAEKITDEGVTGIRSSTTKYRAPAGTWPFEGRAMVEIALITQATHLRAPIRNNSIATSITELTSTTGNANGLQVTTGACDFTPVANLCTIYARSGSNAGQYRITDDTNTTTATWDVEMLQTTATTGEKYVRVPCRVGISYVRFGDNTACSYLNASETPASDYDIIHVTKVQLQESGNEFVEFYFDADAFSTARA